MKRFLPIWIFVLVTTAACKHESKVTSFVSPETGATVASGQQYTIKLDFRDTPDSVRYMLDSTKLGVKKDTGAITAGSAELKMGAHLITATIYRNGDAEDVTTNIVVLAAHAPEKWGYEVVRRYPHDTASFTEGLEYRDGKFYESDGLNNESSLRTADLNTGKVLQKFDMPAEDFAEGIAVVGDKIIQLTWQQRIGYVYDKATLKRLSQFPYTAVGREGWGLLYDGKQLLTTDGSNIIYSMDPNTFRKTGSIEVYDDKGMVDSLNEIELIEGLIYANVWQKDIIVVIDPKTGAVVATIDLSTLYPKTQRDTDGADVLNGIAWDAKGKRLFVTGKKWDRLFEIRIKK